MKKLQDKLFKNYDSTINPYATRFTNFTWNSKGSFASVTLMRSRLLSVQEKEQQFSTATGVIIEWTDPRLTWNASQFGGINHLYMRRGRVWMPEIVPCEATAVTPVALFETTNVKIWSTGQVIMLSYFFATHNCKINADNFPFDINHCMLCFALSGNYGEELMLRGFIGTGEFDYEAFRAKPVLSVSYFNDEAALSSVFYHMVITRQPQFWVCLIILPTFFIGMLVLIGIFFGEDSHSLNGLVEVGLTGMMSLTVIVGILNDSIAKSKDLSALGRFVFYDIIIVVVAIIVILFTQKLRRRLKKVSEQKLKCDQSSRALWQYIRRYGASSEISRYTLFFIFFALHLINLIMMLIRPEDTGAFESLTSFNATYS
ncbi:hypothetical protein PENTCL1PPCAC_1023, partial [Pristionchus entomophagus]